MRAAVPSFSATAGNVTFPTRFHNLCFVHLLFILFECSQYNLTRHNHIIIIFTTMKMGCEWNSKLNLCTWPGVLCMLHKLNACEPNVQSELTLSRKSQNKTWATLLSLSVFSGAGLGTGSPGAPVSQYTVPRTRHLTWLPDWRRISWTLITRDCLTYNAKMKIRKKTSLFSLSFLFSLFISTYRIMFIIFSQLPFEQHILFPNKQSYLINILL